MTAEDLIIEMEVARDTALREYRRFARQQPGGHKWVIREDGTDITPLDKDGERIDEEIYMGRVPEDLEELDLMRGVKEALDMYPEATQVGLGGSFRIYDDEEDAEHGDCPHVEWWQVAGRFTLTDEGKLIRVTEHGLTIG